MKFSPGWLSVFLNAFTSRVMGNHFANVTTYALSRSNSS